MRYEVTVTTGGGEIRKIDLQATGPDGARKAAEQIAYARDCAARGSSVPPRAWKATYVRQTG
jgi:hypothetical protein